MPCCAHQLVLFTVSLSLIYLSALTYAQDLCNFFLLGVQLEKDKKT